jgi:hypothetical protein
MVHGMERVFLEGPIAGSQTHMTGRKARIRRISDNLVDQAALAAGAFGSGLSCRFDQEM